MRRQFHSAAATTATALLLCLAVVAFFLSSSCQPKQCLLFILSELRRSLQASKILPERRAYFYYSVMLRELWDGWQRSCFVATECTDWHLYGMEGVWDNRAISLRQSPTDE